MEKIWEHLIYDQLGMESSDHPFLLTHSARCFESRHTKMCQVFFEKLYVSFLHIALNAVLSLHASGRATGIVLNSGTEATEIVPIHEGVAIKRDIGFSDLCGQDFTDYLLHRLCKRGCEFLATRPGIHGIDIVDGIKKENCLLLLRGGTKVSFVKVKERKSGNSNFPMDRPFDLVIMRLGSRLKDSSSRVFMDRTDLVHLVTCSKLVKAAGDHIRKELSDNVVLVC